MSVIPANINKTHILKAIERFDKEGLPDKNADSYKKCEGILLYPTVDEEFEGAMWELDGRKLQAKMINLNQDWNAIHSDLLSIINN